MPRCLAWARRMRTHIEWNVETHIAKARRPIRLATRCFISAAALLVKVMARMSFGPQSPKASR